jgi:3-oxoacyl-[acyl-carrier-protein] synthase-3
MPCFITQTGSFLPGEPVGNEDIETFLGAIEGEAEVKQKVLQMNGIQRRFYAQDAQQQATHDVYELGSLAVQACDLQSAAAPITFLSAGTTYAPFAGPGIASILHHRLQQAGVLNQPVEISSHAGICTSAAAALVSAIRAVASGEHATAICVGSEHASQVLKASVIRPIDDRAQHNDLRQSQWFMSVFLRFMLSDGAGAFLLESQPSSDRLSWRVNWSHSLSMANEAPLCMKLDNSNALLSQDVGILSRYLVPCSRKFLADAFQTHADSLDTYDMILPHMSSFFFRRKMERVLQDHVSSSQPVPYWTNLASVGNTGAASIYLMLDEYVQQHAPKQGQRIMLFVPESGQFNFVMVSLTAVVP